MWGADDPDDRKPMVWADLRYEDETTHPFGRPRPRNRVEPDTALFRVYRELVALRKQHLRLFVDGAFNWLVTDDGRRLLAYERVLGGQRAVVAFNASDADHELSLTVDDSYRHAYPAGDAAPVRVGSGRFRLPARTASVWIRGQ